MLREMYCCFCGQEMDIAYVGQQSSDDPTFYVCIDCDEVAKDYGDWVEFVPAYAEGIGGEHE